MTKKRNIIIIASLSLLFSLIFKEALHDHNHAHHHHNTRSYQTNCDTITIGANIKILQLKTIYRP
ncbi:MAG: hypothetical protein JXR68_09445 [Bacteroidales bacterium]|nr:hypothetical protein [Bacteroidales bacterium]